MEVSGFSLGFKVVEGKPISVNDQPPVYQPCCRAFILHLSSFSLAFTSVLHFLSGKWVH